MLHDGLHECDGRLLQRNLVRSFAMPLGMLAAVGCAHDTLACLPYSATFCRRRQCSARCRTLVPEECHGRVDPNSATQQVGGCTSSCWARRWWQSEMRCGSPPWACRAHRRTSHATLSASLLTLPCSCRLPHASPAQYPVQGSEAFLIDKWRRYVQSLMVDLTPGIVLGSISAAGCLLFVAWVRRVERCIALPAQTEARRAGPPASAAEHCPAPIQPD